VSIAVDQWQSREKQGRRNADQPGGERIVGAGIDASGEGPAIAYEAELRRPQRLPFVAARQQESRR
jgi:hypothetical protein